MRVLVVLLAIGAAGCNPFGPARSVEGVWVAQQGKFSFVCLSLEQVGDTITGTAWARSDGFALYSGVPVHGEHPRVQFTVGPNNVAACCPHLAGTTFAGRQDSTDDIVGRLGAGDIRFELDNRDLCAPSRT